MTADPDCFFESKKSSLRLTVPGPLSVPRSPDNQQNFSDGPSLRRAQLGAVFATVAHFTVSREAALVSMPTGTGKSAVMTLLPFVMGSKRVLVVTPSKLLREQLTAEFLVSGCFATPARSRLTSPDRVRGRLRVSGGRLAIGWNLRASMSPWEPPVCFRPATRM